LLKQFDIYLDWIGSDMFENKTVGYDSCFIFSELSLKKVLTSAIHILNEANTRK